jgi:hypothetical protein
MIFLTTTAIEIDTDVGKRRGRAFRTGDEVFHGQIVHGGPL